MSLNFGQIPPLTTELAALERLKNRCHHVISVDIDPIFFKLAGNKDMHYIMNEFEFRPDWTTDYGVNCPWASKKYPNRPYNWENDVSTFSLLFLIESFWYFHLTRTSIKAWMSLNFLKWDLTLAHWTQVSDRCPLGYLLYGNYIILWGIAIKKLPAWLLFNSSLNITFGGKKTVITLLFLAHLSRRLTRWAYRMGLEPASVCPCVRLCVHTFKHEYLRDQQADYNQILYEASLGWGKGCIRFWCRSDQNSGFHGNG